MIPTCPLYYQLCSALGLHTLPLQVGFLFSLVALPILSSPSQITLYIHWIHLCGTLFCFKTLHVNVKSSQLPLLQDGCCLPETISHILLMSTLCCGQVGHFTDPNLSSVSFLCPPEIVFAGLNDITGGHVILSGCGLGLSLWCWNTVSVLSLFAVYIYYPNQVKNSWGTGTKFWNSKCKWFSIFGAY